MDLARLGDESAIRDLFTTFAFAMDTRDWELMASIFAEDATLDPGFVGSPPWRGPDGIAGSLAEVTAPHVISHHLITNHRIAIEGDTARAVAYQHAVHCDDADDVGVVSEKRAWYLCDAVRTPQGWKFSAMRHIVAWLGGNPPPSTGLNVDAPAVLRDFIGRSP